MPKYTNAKANASAEDNAKNVKTARFLSLVAQVFAWAIQANVWWSHYLISNQIAEAVCHLRISLFKPEYTIVIIIHYKSRIATAIRGLMKMTWSGWKGKENCYVLVNQFYGNIHSKTFGCWKIKSVFTDVKWCFNASWGLKGLRGHICHFIRWQIRPLFVRFFCSIFWLI